MKISIGFYIDKLLKLRNSKFYTTIRRLTDKPDSLKAGYAAFINLA